MVDIAIALGTFDGIHLGHTAVLNQTVGLKQIALTFNTPPKAGTGGNLLMTAEAKNSALRLMGIEPIVLDFQSIKDTAPLDFLNGIYEKYSPKVIASGFNFRFGKNAAGDSRLLADFCKEKSIEYRLANAVQYEGEAISSTRIRGLISNGDITTATKMLGRYFTFETAVVHGDERGRTIGFPTINQVYPTELVVPKFGVYASVATIDGKDYPAVTDIGVRPTFKTDYVISETNIIGYNSDAYEKTVRISLVDFIRPETRFSGIDELKTAIERDKKIAERILKDVLK